MIEILKLADLPSKPWKNKKGLTIELAIEPQDAHFPEDEFDWRLSCADIQSDSPFSKFEGYHRQLIVWKGNGITLNEDPVPPLHVKTFSGSESQDCKLIQGSVRDLGLIFNPDKVHSTMMAVKVSNRQKDLHFEKNEVGFVFCSDGNFLLNDQKINSKTVAFLKNESKVTLDFKDSATLILIRIQRLPGT